MPGDAATHCAVKLSLEASELPPGSGRGNLSSRLVFAGERWQGRDLCGTARN